MNSIGKILQDRRKELGLTQPDVNKELKQFGYSMNHAAISSWERNVTRRTPHSFWHSARFSALQIFTLHSSENIHRIIRSAN